MTDNQKAVAECRARMATYSPEKRAAIRKISREIMKNLTKEK